MKEYFLQMKNISKYFMKTPVLKDVSFNVKKGTVHALVGENGAGKSTLMKCLFGIYKIDKGEIFINDTKVNISTPNEALKYGMAMVNQELETMDNRNIAENIFCNRYPTKKFGPISIINHNKMYDEANKYLKNIGLSIDSKKLLGNLSISQKQLVEISKALSIGAKLVILDEPTSSLTDNETKILFDTINELKNTGVSFIYISHKMNEILNISDEVTILRDGSYVGTWDAKNLETDTIIKNMVGRELTDRFPKKNHTLGDVVLKIENYSSINNGLRNISFELKKGEILGIGGLVGSKRTELVETIFGIRNKDTGTINFKGSQIQISEPKDAIKNGFAFITEDRRATGIFSTLSITDNISIVSIDDFIKNFYIINNEKLDEKVDEDIKNFNIKLSDKKEEMQFLSGGNQQKAIIARWLMHTPDILILDEPTRGIDVKAKYDIYNIISELSKSGKSIIMISSEIPELIGMSDRILVMSDGQIAGELNSKDATQEKIMTLATKYLI